MALKMEQYMHKMFKWSATKLNVTQNNVGKEEVHEINLKQWHENKWICLYVHACAFANSLPVAVMCFLVPGYGQSTP